MRLFKNCLSPVRSSKTYLHDKNNKPLSGFHVPFTKRSRDESIEDYNRFKAEYGAYFASNEHVSQGPFAHNFGSFIRHDDWKEAQ